MNIEKITMIFVGIALIAILLTSIERKKNIQKENIELIENKVKVIKNNHLDKK